MANCLWPNKSKTKSLKLNAEGENPSIEVAARLAIAVDILCERFGIRQEDVNPDSSLLAEIMRQLYGQKWLGKDMGGDHETLRIWIVLPEAKAQRALQEL